MVKLLLVVVDIWTRGGMLLVEWVEVRVV